MRRGEYETAWMISDAALCERAGVPCWHWPRHLQYVWGGTPLQAKRVLIRCYHGLGDTLMFIRYAPLVKAIAQEVIVWAQPALLPLLRTVRGIDWLLPLHDGAPDVAYDVDVESMELPHVFRTTLATIPADTPYLHIEPAAQANNGRVRFGLVWSAGDWEHERRSIPFARLAPLARIPHVELHILQRGPALAERPPDFGILSGADDIAQTARHAHTQPGAVGGHDARASGGRARRARLAAARHAWRLALNGWSPRQPVVSQHAHLPPAAAW